MAFRRVFEGEGSILFEGRDIPASYHIVEERTPDLISASGTVKVDPKAFAEIANGSNLAMQMRLASGEVVDINFLGGDIWSPAAITVESRMPGA